MTDVTRAHLHADCALCAGLCCVAPAFARSSDFAIDKPAGSPCPHLLADHRCGIHGELADRGFAGCRAFDCFGAGQHVVQVTLPGRDWRASPQVAAEVFAVFDVLQQLHEMLWYLAEAAARDVPEPLRAEARALHDATARIARQDAASLCGLDVDAHRRRVADVLSRVSDHVRGSVNAAALDRRGADLVGGDLRRLDLRGAMLRGALLLGADLREADLEATDLLSADLRSADVRGARLAGALFVTQRQVNGARGDARTTLPPDLQCPRHWAGGPAG